MGVRGVGAWGGEWRRQCATDSRIRPVAVRSTRRGGRAAIAWGVYGMPETFILDAQGRIAYKHIGALTPEAVDTVLIPAINKARRGS